MCCKTVLILVLVVVETFVRDDLGNRKSLIIDYGDGDLSCLNEFLDKDLLAVRSRIVDGCLIFVLCLNDGYAAGRTVADRLNYARQADLF